VKEDVDSARPANTDTITGGMTLGGRKGAPKTAKEPAVIADALASYAPANGGVI